MTFLLRPVSKGSDTSIFNGFIMKRIDGIVQDWDIPADTGRNKNVIITSKRRRGVVLMW